MTPITFVLDPADSAACATAVTNLACLPHGRVVCHPTPGGSLTWLGRDLLLALGKRFDALQAEAYPLVPAADFPIFRAVCRRLLDPVSFAIVDRTFAAALAETLTWLGTQREIREHFRSLELELGELDGKIPRTQYILDCQVR